MRTIVKLVVWLLIALTITVIYLVSLLVTKNEQIKLLKMHNTELSSHLEDCKLDNANALIEKEMLYKDVTHLTVALRTQTQLVKELTLELSELKYKYISLQEQKDALGPYLSPKNNTASRGF